MKSIVMLFAILLGGSFAQARCIAGWSTIVNLEWPRGAQAEFCQLGMSYIEARTLEAGRFDVRRAMATLRYAQTTQSMVNNMCQRLGGWQYWGVEVRTGRSLIYCEFMDRSRIESNTLELGQFHPANFQLNQVLRLR